MSDRESPPSNQGGPGGGPPPPPRRGFLSRNPFLIILLVVAGIFLVLNVFTASRSTPVEYGFFWRYLESMPDAPAGAETASGKTEGDPKAEEPAPGEEKEGEKVAEEEEKAPADGFDGRIVSVRILPREIRGEMVPAEADLRDNKALAKAWSSKRADAETISFTSEAQQDTSGKLRDLLHRKGVEFRYENPTDWQVAILWALPILFFVFLFAMMFRSSRMSGENVLSFGRSRAKVVGEDKTGVTFEDVAGAKEAKEELEEIVDFLKEPERFTSLGGKIPKGCLLVGPPGCGKTLLARAVAGEAGVPFFSISGSDFVEMFVGVGAARVRDLFNTAKQKAPCIIFVDEIDAVGRHRGTGLGGGHDEREQTLNQLLVEMDGFDGRKGVIVLAATNRPDILDPALLRPGRFDRNVVLDPPDLAGRRQVLEIHSRGKPLSPDVQLGEIARRTPGFSGADLANVMNEAALLAARRRLEAIGMAEVAEAIERVIAGPERRSRVIGPQEKKVLAYHELGHALVARYSGGSGRVRKISIIPRGRGALGYTLTVPDEDRYITTRDELLARMRMTLGGRAAEEVVFGHKSTGAEDDLQKVTNLARSIVCRWGMTDDLGPVAYDTSPGTPFLGREVQQHDKLSESTASQIDQNIKQLVTECYGAATEILRTNRELLDQLATLLLSQEVLEMNEFEEAVQKYATIPPPPLEPLEDVAPESPSAPNGVAPPRPPSAEPPSDPGPPGSAPPGPGEPPQHG